MSAGQVLEATKVKVTGRMKKALEDVAREKEAKGEGSSTREEAEGGGSSTREKEAKGEGSSTREDSTARPIVDPLFKGVSPALLKRVCVWVCVDISLVVM